MKDRRLKKLEDKYFDGQSSLEEEKEVRKSETAFFQVLNEEKEVKMDWSFEEFTDQVQKKGRMVIWWNSSWVKYTAAAVVLMIVGLSYYIQQQEPETSIVAHQEIRQGQKADAISATGKGVVGEDAKSNETSAIGESRTAGLIPTTSPKKGSGVKPAENKVAKMEQETAELPQYVQEDNYQADYVVLNGKPVANEEEAVELTLKSLGLLANNFENGVDKAMNIKQMSITIN